MDVSCVVEVQIVKGIFLVVETLPLVICFFIGKKLLWRLDQISVTFESVWEYGKLRFLDVFVSEMIKQVIDIFKGKKTPLKILIIFVASEKC